MMQCGARVNDEREVRSCVGDGRDKTDGGGGGGEASWGKGAPGDWFRAGLSFT
jgi:hypothetical protein